METPEMLCCAKCEKELRIEDAHKFPIPNGPDDIDYEAWCDTCAADAEERGY